ncbi:alpha/beta fold hydrolase [Streptomyces sp. KLOTTS4A1]|uniref:alpha/beta fold hydrolase n=1 Tax=Streptomyces sp. KLOTTS4A1 TaxID=3390996 RepID=UPI0039F496D7
MSRIAEDAATTAGPIEYTEVNGVRIAHERTGRGSVPLVFVHGSWGSHHNWDMVVPGLAPGFRVVTYDRRGHSDSGGSAGQGSFAQDVDDLAALIERLGPAPAWVAGNSAGAFITLRLAAARPELLRGIVVHEPPVFSLIPAGSPEEAAYEAIERGPLAEVERLISTGDHEGAAELFVDAVALGPGSWAAMPEALRQTLVTNAPTYLDELRSPDAWTIDESALARYDGPVLITSGDRSPALYTPVLKRLAELLPQAEKAVFHGAGHIPHVTHPEAYVKELLAFTGRHDTRRGGAVESLEVRAPDGTRIAVWVEGAGPPLVMVHGSLQDHTISAALVAELRADLTTYAVDRRGFGASGDGEQGGPAYAIEREFEDVAAVVDAVAERTGGPVALWGHSYGASVAMGAATLTDRVRQLILYEPSLGLDYPEGWIAQVEQAVARGDDEAAIILTLRDVLEFTDEQIDAVRDGPEWARRVAVARTVAREALAEESWVYRPGGFDAVTAETTVLSGTESPPSLKRAAKAAAEALPGARIHVLDGHAHIAHRTDPAMVAALVRQLVAA